jgi:hypothetical protein
VTPMIPTAPQRPPFSTVLSPTEARSPAG